MINSIEFLNVHWILPILLAAALLLLVFIWKDWTQAGKQRFFLKSILAVVAITCLVFIALKPAFPIDRDGGNVILLTKGYSVQQRDSLEQEKGKIKVVEYSPDQLIPKELESAEKIFLLGNGVKEYDLWQLQNAPVVFLGKQEQTGITRIKYLKERTVGDSLELDGIYSKAQEGAKLVLQGPGGAGLDSVVINSLEKQHFRLTAGLKISGKFLYSLFEKDSLGTILRTDPVPVKVLERENLKILVINSFPTFETKYLKNFLAEAGHEMVVKTQITRGRFKYEYFNMVNIAVGNLSEEVLENFDLLIIDATSLRSLPGSELQTLKNSVQTQGLGLFIQADLQYFRSGGKVNGLNFSRLQGSQVNSPKWPGTKLSRASYHFDNDFALQPIHQFDSNIFSAYKRAGQGRIGTTVFTDTWEIILDGKSEVYRRLWTDLVGKISKRKSRLVNWQQEAKMVYKSEPFDFRVETPITDPKIQSGSGSTIPLVNDLNFPSLWKGRIWPRETGWNNLNLDTLGTLDFYVNDHLQWQAISATKTIGANKKFFEKESIVGKGQQALVPLEPLWFFGLFLICIGGLWLEPKL